MFTRRTKPIRIIGDANMWPSPVPYFAIRVSGVKQGVTGHAQSDLTFTLCIHFMYFEELRIQGFACSYFCGLVYARIYLFRPCLHINDIAQPMGNSVR